VSTRTWIGATEAVALLRFAGLRAEVVDFEGRGCGDAMEKWAWRHFNGGCSDGSPSLDEGTDGSLSLGSGRQLSATQPICRGGKGGNPIP